MSLFDRWAKKQKPVEEVIQGKSQPDIVAEIHKEFKTATDSLLVEAKKWLEEQPDTSKGERLAKLGFIGIKTAQEHLKIEMEKKDHERLFHHINQCAIKYPGYKFITNKIAHAIAEKYDLFIGDTRLFNADIPETNLRDIEKFAGLFKERWMIIDRKGQYETQETEVTEEEFNTQLAEMRKVHGETIHGEPKVYFQKPYSRMFSYIHFQHQTIASQLQIMKICALAKDFNLTRQKIQDRYIVDEDPIILFPTELGYIVVTAWGAEASEVVNEQMN